MFRALKFLAVPLFLSPTVSEAAILEVTLSQGTVTGVTDNLSTSFSIGDTASAVYLFDTSVEDTDETTGPFWLNSTTFSVTNENGAVFTTSSGTTFFLGDDMLLVSNQTNGGVFGSENFDHPDLPLTSFVGGAYNIGYNPEEGSSLLQLLEPFENSVFGNIFMLVNFENGQVQYNFDVNQTSARVIPEPTSLAMLGGGALLLIRRRRS